MLTAVLQRVRSNAALVRQPFKLVTSDKPVSRLASKIGGTRPYLPTGTQWPKCGDCEEPMRFFLQFDLSLLPNESPDKARFGSQGLVQLFVCADNGCYDHYAAFSKCSLVRLVDLPTSEHEKQQAEATTVPEADVSKNSFDEISVVGVEKQSTLEVPNHEELLSKGTRVSFSKQCKRFLLLLEIITQEEFNAILEGGEAQDAYDGQVSGPKGGIKVGGWPFWVQGVEYPDCPECKVHIIIIIIFFFRICSVHKHQTTKRQRWTTWSSSSRRPMNCPTCVFVCLFVFEFFIF